MNASEKPDPQPFFLSPEVESDPWRLVDTEAGAEANSWLLSYLDVMTLLFAFVTALFAYQKALSLQDVPIAQQRPAVRMERKLVEPPKPVTVALPVKEVEPPPPSPTIQPTTEFHAPMASVREESRPDIPDPLAPLPEPQPRQDAFVNLAPLAGGFGGAVEVAETEGKLRLEISDAILFDPARAEIKAEGTSVLDRVAYWLRLQEGSIAVEGHTDNRPMSGGRYGSNWELSTARASVVTRYLIEHGVAAERLRAVGLADTQPRVGNDTLEGRARNRRVTLVVYVVRDDGLKI